MTLGRRRALAEMFGVRFAGFPAWVMARAVHLAWLPRLDKKVRVAARKTKRVIASAAAKSKARPRPRPAKPVRARRV